MAKNISASITRLHQVAPMTGAQRAKAYRDRKRAKVPRDEIKAPILVTPAVTSRAVTRPVTPSRYAVAPLALKGAAFALAAVGVTMNGWFARSLGASDFAGWLFLGIGVAADLAALAVPSCAAQLWQAGRRATAAAGWGLWIVTFAFAVTAGIGFASLNISDVTAARASHVTPAIVTAQLSLRDAMEARDRECAHGVGKFCRERERSVNERRATLEGAMRGVEQTADPQTEAAIRLVAWISAGTITPQGNDFAMLRLMLLALLPQVGGLLLMVGRTTNRGD